MTLQWTKEPPTLDGFYWARGTFKVTTEKTETTTAIIIADPENGHAYFLGSEVPSELSEWDWFYGPLEPPPGLLEIPS